MATSSTGHPPQDFHARTAEALHRRLLYLRSLMPEGCRNNTELGGMCEQGVRDLLKEVLPLRFGVGYGHVSYGEDARSGTKPLDVIIYDRLNYGPAYAEGDFVVIPPQAALALIEVKARLTKGAFERAFRDQIADAFVCVGELPEDWSRLQKQSVKDCPGFVIGFCRTPNSVWDYDQSEVTGPLVGYLDVAADRSRIKVAHWREHPRHGFAYWYWRLLQALYEGAMPPLKDQVPAPLPRRYREGKVFEED